MCARCGCRTSQEIAQAIEDVGCLSLPSRHCATRSSVIPCEATFQLCQKAVRVFCCLPTGWDKVSAHQLRDLLVSCEQPDQALKLLLRNSRCQSSNTTAAAGGARGAGQGSSAQQHCKLQKAPDSSSASDPDSDGDSEQDDDDGDSDDDEWEQQHSC